MINQSAAFLNTEVFKDYLLLAIIAIPPLVGQLNVGITFSTGSTGLTSTGLSIVPEAGLHSFSLGDFLVVFLNSLYLIVAPYSHIGRDLFNFSFFGVFPDSLPIFLILSGHRTGTKLDGTF